MSDETQALTPGEPSLDELLAQIVAADESGPPVDRQQLLARHPQFAGELREFFANRDQMRRLAGPLRGSAGGNGSVRTKLRYFGDYELLDEIAAGGMGIVYKARQVSLNRIVAVKMILKGTLASEDDVKRFRAEAEAAANLQHPGIVAIHEVGLHEGQHYFSMDYVDGQSLAQLPREQPLAATQAAEYVRDAAEAVHYAHQQGTLHRDLKPSNILIDAQGRVRITDFGLAKRIESNSDLTLTGQVLGTPSYMPPEQALSKRSLIGTASDVYSMGAVLYELLAGRPPFRGESPGETLRQVESLDPLSPRLLNPATPRDLETICLKCLEKEPHKRYATAQQLADDLGRFLRHEPILARPISGVARAWRWCRRNPVYAAMGTVSTVTALALIATLIVSHALVTDALGERTAALGKLAEANVTLKDEQRKVQEALRAKSTALVDLEASNRRVTTTLLREQQNAYSHAIALAHREWQANNVYRAEQILDALPAERRGWEWLYLKRVCRLEALRLQWPAEDRNGARKSLHEGFVVAVNSIAFSPDGKRLLCGGGEVDFGEEGQLKVWDLATQSILFTCSHELGPVFKAVYSPDGNLIASVDKEGAIKIWNAASGESISTINQDSWILGVQFSPDGKQLATTPPTTLWDVESGEEVQQFPGGVWDVAFSGDGKRLAAAGNDAIQIWELAGGQEIANLKGHSGNIYSIAFSPDGQRLASASADGTAKVWNSSNGREIVTYRGHRTAVYRVAFGPDGKTVATVGGDYSAVVLSQPGDVKLWSATDAKEILTLRGHPSATTDVAFDPAANRLATVSKDGSIIVWDLAASREARTFRGGGSGSSGSNLLFSTTGALMLTPQGRFARIWDVATGKAVMSLDCRKNTSIEKLALSPDQKLLAMAVNGGDLKLWNLETQQESRTLKGFVNTSSLTFTPEGNELLAAGNGGQGWKVWNPSTGDEAPSGFWNRFKSGTLQFSQDGKRFLYVQAGKFQVWAWPEQQEVCAGNITPQGSTASALSRDGTLVAIAASDRHIRIYDAESGRELQTLQGHVGQIHGMSFHPDNARLASCGADKSIKIWDRESGSELLTLREQNEVLYGVAFSPDGHYLAARSMGGSVWIWEAARRQPSATENR